MNRKLRIAVAGTLAVLACGALGALAQSASAQKGVLGFGADPNTGVVDPEPGGDRYTAIKAGDGTIVARISTDDGHIVRSTFQGESLAVPAVAYDGTPGGLAADGDRFVLTEPGVRFPQRQSDFTVLDTERLHVLDQVTLPGTFTFDAISPDGRWLYLIEYMSRTDLTQYQVRRYDLQRGRLDPEPVVDPEAAPVTMGGTPQTRAMSPDGRWAYTLYDSPTRDRPPFIHALDTKTGSAACIDLEGGLVEERRLFRMTLDPSPDGSTLAVVDPRAGPAAIVDTETFDVSEPPVEEASADSASDGSGGTPWPVIALGVLGAGGLLTVAVRRRRGSPAVDSDDLERLVRIEEEPEPKSEEREKEWDRVR